MSKSSLFARKLDSVLKWLFRAAVAAILLCVLVFVVSVVILRIDPSFAKEIMNTVFLSNLSLSVTDSAIPSASFATVYLLIDLAFFLLSAGISCVCLKLLRNILKPMIEQQPFHASVSQNLKKLGWSSLVLGIGYGCFSAVETMVLYRGYNLDTLLLNEYITKVVPQFRFNLDFVLVAVVLFLLSYIFKYGEQLQQQVDETL
jgi:hypothetical protein